MNSFVLLHTAPFVAEVFGEKRQNLFVARKPSSIRHSTFVILAAADRRSVSFALRSRAIGALELLSFTCCLRTRLNENRFRIDDVIDRNFCAERGSDRNSFGATE